MLACSDLGSRINLTQWDYSGPVRSLREGDTIDLGDHRLRLLETPHLHHWDSLMVFEERMSSLFPADLYVQSRDQPAIVRENLGKEMCQLYREWGIFAAEVLVLGVVERIEKLDAQWINPMHGGSLPKEGVPSYTEALWSEAFAFKENCLVRRYSTET